MIGEQISMFDDHPGECCYNCRHFEKFEAPREYTNRDGEFGMFGVCLKTFNKKRLVCGLSDIHSGRSL